MRAGSRPAGLSTPTGPSHVPWAVPLLTLRPFPTRHAPPTGGGISPNGAKKGHVAIPKRLKGAAASATAPATREAPTAAESSPNPLQDSSPFDWERQWYPVSPVVDLDPARPLPFDLLGHKIVVWADGGGQWRACEDACPHRLAPLSQGRIEPSDGSLMCSYHGWRFNGEGDCVDVPQADGVKENAVACASRRSRVATYPVQVKMDMLWVWADSSPTAFIDSAVRGPRLPGHLEDHSEAYVGLAPLVARDLFYGHNLLVENLMDPSHVPFAHHGVQGNRKDATPLKMTRVNAGNGSQTDGLKYDVESVGRSDKRNLEFIFPACISYYSFSPDKVAGVPSFSSTFYCTPTSAGKSRVHSQFFLHRDAMSKGRGLRQVMMLLLKLLSGGKPPAWLVHMSSNKVLDGDMILLHNQGHTMKRMRKGTGRLKHQEMFFLAMEADRAIDDMLEWYHDPAQGNGGPKGPGGELLSDGPEETREEVILDRYEQHTKYCKACNSALRVVESLKPIAQWVSTVLVAAFVSLAFTAEPRTAVLSKGWPLILGATLCALAVKLLARIQRSLRFVPYAHHSS